jgi:hypothetical protein
MMYNNKCTYFFYRFRLLATIFSRRINGIYERDDSEAETGLMTKARGMCCGDVLCSDLTLQNNKITKCEGG